MALLIFELNTSTKTPVQNNEKQTFIHHTQTNMTTSTKIVFLAIALAFAVLAPAWMGRESVYLEIKVKAESASIAPVLLYDIGQGKGNAETIRGTLGGKVYPDGFRKLSFLLPENKKITGFRIALGSGVVNAQLHDAKITKKPPLEIFQRKLTNFSPADFILFNSKTSTSTLDNGKLQIQSSAGAVPHFGLKVAKPLASDASVNWLQFGIVFALLFGMWLYLAKKILPGEFVGNVLQRAREKLTLEDFNLPTDLPVTPNLAEDEYTKIKNQISIILNKNRVFVLVAFGFVLCVINYWFELTNFTFSADEGMAFWPDFFRFWFHERRWMQGLIAYVLPSEFGGLPFLAIAICCVAFPFSASILAITIFQRLRFQLLFTALFVSCPVFPHSVEFNVNSHGVALGGVLASLAVWTVLSEKLGAKQLARSSLMLACAFGCYQSHVFYFFCASVIAIIMRGRGWKRFFLASLVSTIAVLLSMLSEKLFQFIFDINKTRTFLTRTQFGKIWSNPQSLRARSFLGVPVFFCKPE
jgi:hypothetical protein